MAVWCPALDANGHPDLPVLVREHLERRRLMASAGYAELTESTELTQPTFENEVEEDSSSGYEDMDDEDEDDEDMDNEEPRNNVSSGKEPHTSVLHTFTGPSWFPFGLEFRLEGYSIYSTITYGQDRFALPACIGQSQLDDKNDEIAALVDELEDRYNEIADLEAALEEKNEEMEDFKTAAEQKSKDQRANFAAAHEDLSAIRENVKGMCEIYNKLRARNEAHKETIKEQKTTIGEQKVKIGEMNTFINVLSTDYENLERLNEDLQRENENWKTTMHALHNPHDAEKDSEIANLKSQLVEFEKEKDKLKDKNVYLHRANITNAMLATQAQNKLGTALWDVEVLRAELSESQDELSSTQDKLSSTQEKIGRAHV